MDRKKQIATRRKIISGRNNGIAYLLGVFVSVAAAWLFFDSWWGLILGLGIIPYSAKVYKKVKEDKQRDKKMQELKEFFLLLSSYMQAGCSIENALIETECEMLQLLGKNSELLPMLHRANQKIAMSTSAEQAIWTMSKEIGIEEAYTFADVLLYGKRLGGNYVENLRQTASQLEERISITQEINTMMAEKKLEMRIMSIMPVGILLFMRVTSKEYLAGLYHNPLGVLVMSVCIIVYVTMILWGSRIMDITV